ncbi:ankyrin repeat domain-containing protein [Pseudomonas alabamensis]|uniref:ankyrin repeat domain-containing protein n=1 Tax=Pseudomonas alabamensis TaxID=3064349 RepID=UPI003F650064
MSYPPALLAMLEETLKIISFSVDDLPMLEIGGWHVAVLLDDLAHLRSLPPAAMNVRDGAESTPLDIAYQLGRTTWIKRLEALGAEGDKSLLDWKGLGSFLSPDSFARLPGRRGIIKTLVRRYQQGRSLNDRDAAGNTPLHWLAANGHSKAANYFSKRFSKFCLDLSARNNEGHTARNVATLAGHHDIAARLLTREIDNYLRAARTWQQILATMSNHWRN